MVAPKIAPNGPSTLSDDLGEVEIVGAPTLGGLLGLNPANPGSSTRALSTVTVDPTMRDPAVSVGGTVQRAPDVGPTLSSITNPADRAMLNSAAAAGAQGTPAAPGTPNNFTPTPLDPTQPMQDLLDLSRANLADLLTGIASDSEAAFGRLRGVAQDRGDATQQSIREVNARIAADLAGVPGQISADPSGGLGGGRLESGAAAGSAGVAQMQAALGGFLEGSQARRTNAFQNYLTGLEAQSQVARDRAATAGEFALAQQQALIDRERALQQQDVAATAAQQAQADALLQSLGIEPVPGLSIDQALDFAREERQRREAFGPADGEDPEAIRGLAEETFVQSGINPGVAAPLSQLEVQGQEFFNTLPLEQATQMQAQGLLDADGAPTIAGIRNWLDQNVIIVSDQDERYGRFTNVGGQGQRLGLTMEDYQRYLQWASGTFG